MNPVLPPRESVADRASGLSEIVRSLAAAVIAAAAMAIASAEDLRIGLIGLDSSHCIQYTKLLQAPGDKDHVEGARVVAAFKGGSADVKDSADRVDKFADEISGRYGVPLYSSIGEMMGKVDAVMILSVDGRTHLKQAREVFRYRKPVFVDKPAAGSLRDGIELFKEAQAVSVPCFSSSSIRFGPQMEALKAERVGKLQGAFAFGPAPTEPHHPDLFWYGIHTVESLYTVMGLGCVTVVRTYTPDTDVVTGVWRDGRVGTVRGIRNAKGGAYGLIIFGSNGFASEPAGHSYAPHLREIINFFRTGVAPVSADETIELLAFMEAADESKRRGGMPVLIADIMRANQ